MTLCRWPAAEPAKTLGASRSVGSVTAPWSATSVPPLSSGLGRPVAAGAQSAKGAYRLGKSAAQTRACPQHQDLSPHVPSTIPAGHGGSASRSAPRNRRRELRKCEDPLPESDDDHAERPGRDRGLAF